MKQITNLLTAAALASLLASCSADIDSPLTDTPLTVDGRSVSLTVGLSDNDNLTRTFYEAEGINLTTCWSGSEQLVVTNDISDGSEPMNLGVLTYQSRVNDSDFSGPAYFSGVITIPEGVTKIRLNYLSGHNCNLTTVKGSINFDMTSQTGWYKEADMGQIDPMYSDPIEIPANVDHFNISTTMKRHMSFGVFDLQVPFTLNEGEVITVSDADGNPLYVTSDINLHTGESSPADKGFITINYSSCGFEYTQKGNHVIENRVFVGMVPQTCTLKFSFTRDNVTYSAVLGSNTWLAENFYRNDNTSSSNGIPVTNWTITTIPEPVDDTVGPVFTVNSKKFKFTKANLAYNIADEKWYLLDKQYSKLGIAGWEYLNGTWYKDQAKTTDIDLFGFGCTGLYDIEKDIYANKPTFYRQTTTNGSDRHYDGSYFPTQNTEVNKGNGYIGSYLENGIAGTVYDWGTAYAREIGSNSSYFTLSSSDWTQLKANYFMAAAIISSNGTDRGTGYVQGCLIFPCKDASDAVDIIKGVNPYYLNETSVKEASSLSFTSNNSKFDATWIRLTFEQFADLENKNVVFIPVAGYRSITSYSSEGEYWTSSTGQQYVSTALRFNGTSSVKVFKLDGNSVRSMGCSVRLVKEVTE